MYSLLVSKCNISDIIIIIIIIIKYQYRKIVGISLGYELILRTISNLINKLVLMQVKLM